MNNMPPACMPKEFQPSQLRSRTQPSCPPLSGAPSYAPAHPGAGAR